MEEVARKVVRRFLAGLGSFPVVAKRRTAMVKLPSFLRLNDARKYKQTYFESLSAFGVEVLDTASHGHVFGAAPGTESTGKIVLTPRGRGVEGKVVEGGQKTLDLMVRSGWLRFAKMQGSSGYFWPTDAAERLWQVLGR